MNLRCSVLRILNKFSSYLKKKIKLRISFPILFTCSNLHSDYRKEWNKQHRSGFLLSVMISTSAHVYLQFSGFN